MSVVLGVARVSDQRTHIGVDVDAPTAGAQRI